MNNSHCDSCLKANLPMCSYDNNCNVSCIIRWYTHSLLCDDCHQHLSSISCDNLHCQKIRALSSLTSNIISKLDDKLIFDLKLLLSIDFTNLQYKGTDEYTIQLFSLLEYFTIFSIQMISLNSNVTNEDLLYILNYIIRSKLN